MNTNQLIRQNKGEWLAELTGQASVNAHMFSTEDFDVGDNYKLHGSVQCPRDLSSLDLLKTVASYFRGCKDFRYKKAMLLSYSAYFQ
ncbi:hypothetical protein CFP56_008604 [Quercus suber]|uniref:Uncharacterized protein n=1 Tax=Quercus suber TaxID=58331 RepID=A0AAW0L572_QUESU